MKKNEIYVLRFLLLVCVVVVLNLVSCNATNVGIFSTLSTEQRLDPKNNGISSTSTNTKFVRYAPNGASGNAMYLVVSGTRLRVADISAALSGTDVGLPASQWQQTSTPAGKPTCLDVAVSDTAVYAIFTPDTSTDPQLYRAVFTTSGAASSVVWYSTVTPNPETYSYKAERVFALYGLAGSKNGGITGDKVLFETMNDLEQESSTDVCHQLYLVSGPTPNSGAGPATLSAAIQFPNVYTGSNTGLNSSISTNPIDTTQLAGSYGIIGVAVDNNIVYAINQFNLYFIPADSTPNDLESTTPSFTMSCVYNLSPTKSPTPNNSGTLSAITVDTLAHRLYIAGSDGMVYRNKSDTVPSLYADNTWTNPWVANYTTSLSGYSLSTICPIISESGSNTIALNGFTGIGTVLIAGTANSKGLVTILDNGGSYSSTSTQLITQANISGNTLLNNSSSYSSSNIGSKSITSIFWPGGTDPVFVGTTQLGLWSATYDGSSLAFSTE